VAFYSRSLLLAVMEWCDSVQVRAHGVRALGNLFALVGHGVAVAGASPSWIPSSVQFVMAALETGSVKVQWNACCAANALFRSQVAAAMEPVRAQIPAILAQLLALAQECQNLKIRTHAVGALMALSRRGDFGDTYCNAVKVACMSYLLEMRAAWLIPEQLRCMSFCPFLISLLLHMQDGLQKDRYPTLRSEVHASLQFVGW